MKKIFFLLLTIIIVSFTHAQNIFRAVVRDQNTREFIPGVNASLHSTRQGASSNAIGFLELINIPAGEQSIQFSHSGYESKTLSLLFPLNNSDTIEIFLESSEEELEEVVIKSTRTSRTISNTPTRVEIIDGEELDEKNNMRPANVSMLLHESTGILVQQTSATSGNASIRVQGLDGRYTQLLKDGYPNYGSFAGGLSILEIPPLDLRQVEVIKGPASTLYGAGAIAGVVNFISREPEEKPVRDFLINQSMVGQTNLAAYLSQRNKKFGYSLLTSVNFQKAYDVDDDDFSELPRNNNFTIHPGLYFYSEASGNFQLSHSYTHSNIEGGDMLVIGETNSPGHTYFEKNKSTRNTTTMEWEKHWGSRRLSFRQSLNFYDRGISIPGYRFGGRSANSFSDISYLSRAGKHTMIGGFNFVWERFRQDSINAQNSNSQVTGAYFQDTWDISGQLQMESGMRIDYAHYVNLNDETNRVFFLPRVSILFKPSSKITSRVSAGLGYKLPTIFTEEAEARQFRDIQPLDGVLPERSAGATADFNYRAKLGRDWNFSINQLFFYTWIERPLVLMENGVSEFYYVNASRPIFSNGFETNLKLIFKETLKLFAGYTYTNGKAKYKTGDNHLSLLPKNKVNLVLMFEKEDNFKLGLESYFTGNQFLSDGSRTPSYWEFGFMAQKTFGKISFFVNFENFTDERQSNYKTVVNPPHDNPSFDEIWNHTEGFIINGGIKLRL